MSIIGVGGVFFSVVLGLSQPTTSPIVEKKWAQIWPCEADGRKVFNRQPSTGPGAYAHFRWAGMGTWKRYKVRKGVPIIIRAHGDSCPGCCLGCLAFRMSEFVNGKKAERFVFRGPKWRGEKPPGEPGYRLVYYVPQSEKFEIACIGTGFYVAVYQLVEIKRKADPLTDEDRTKIVELIKKMDDDSWKVRRQAQSELEKMGKKILPFLRTVLEKDKEKYSFEVCLRIEMLINTLDPPKTNIISDREMKKQSYDLADKLAVNIGDKKLSCDSEQAKSLALIGPYAAEPLKKQCSSKSEHVRAAAVCALAKLADAGSVEAIIFILKSASEKDVSERVRKQASESLKQLLKNRRQKPTTAPASP